MLTFGQAEIFKYFPLPANAWLTIYSGTTTIRGRRSRRPSD